MREAWPGWLDDLAAYNWAGVQISVLSDKYLEVVELDIHLEGSVRVTAIPGDAADINLPSPPRPWGPRKKLPFSEAHLATLGQIGQVPPPIPFRGYDRIQFHNTGSVWRYRSNSFDRVSHTSRPTKSSSYFFRPMPPVRSREHGPRLLRMTECQSGTTFTARSPSPTPKKSASMSATLQWSQQVPFTIPASSTQPWLAHTYARRPQSSARTACLSPAPLEAHMRRSWDSEISGSSSTDGGTHSYQQTNLLPSSRTLSSPRIFRIKMAQHFRIATTRRSLQTRLSSRLRGRACTGRTNRRTMPPSGDITRGHSDDQSVRSGV